MKKPFSIIRELLLIAFTLIVSLILFLFISQPITKSYEITRHLFNEDYVRFKNIFTHFHLLLFMALRVVMPFLGFYYLIKKLKVWLHGSHAFTKFNLLKIHHLFKQLGIYMRLFHIMVIVLLLFFTESYLQKSGYTPGSYYKEFRVVDKLEDYSIYYSDSTGMIRMNRGSKYIPDYYGHVNSDGFRSRYEFDSLTVACIKKQEKKLIMFIGDSYTEGLSAMPRDSCFVELIDRNPAYAAFNLGIAGTDPLQYELVAQHYVPLIKPDAVVVVKYSNDVMQYDRITTPHIPIYYCNNAFANGNLGAAQKPIEWGFKPKDILKTNEDAYKFYKRHCIVSQNSYWARVFSRSVIGTLIWKQFHARADPNNYITNFDLPYTYNHLKTIQHTCDSLNIPVLFWLIPYVNEFSEPKQKVIERYSPAFKDLSVHYATGITTKDHIGITGDTHFNNSGHAKFALNVTKVLDSVFACRK